MKNLIVLLFVVLAACSTDDPAPKNYDSLAGKWEFTGTGISGNFVVGPNASSFLVIQSGTFKTDGHSHSIDIPTSILAGSVLTLTLIDDDGDNLSFTNSVYSSDFKEIQSDGFFYQDGANSVTKHENILITRK